MQLRYQLTRPDAIPPRYAIDGNAAAFDLSACLVADDVLTPWADLVIDTGVAFEVPQGWALLVMSRSGHGFRYGVRLANCVGLIDPGYTGSIKVRLTMDGSTNGGQPNLPIKHGDRIAQAMLVPAPTLELVQVDSLALSQRGDGGFGSTGS